MAIDERSERRNGPRANAPDDQACRLELRMRVRLVDISLTGALIASENVVPHGVHARLRTTVGSAPFSSDVQVKRVAGSGGRDVPAALGAAFTEMDDPSRRGLEAFLEKASREG